MEFTYKVLVRIDAAGSVIAINSNAFLQDTTGWVQIDEGSGDKFHHAQGNYLPTPLMDDQCHYLYKLADGAVVERTTEELEADALSANESTPTIDQRTAALETTSQQQAVTLDEIITILEAIV